jgi:hypothetical protein
MPCLGRSASLLLLARPYAPAWGRTAGRSRGHHMSPRPAAQRRDAVSWTLRVPLRPPPAGIFPRREAPASRRTSRKLLPPSSLECRRLPPFRGKSKRELAGASSRSSALSTKIRIRWTPERPIIRPHAERRDEQESLADSLANPTSEPLVAAPARPEGPASAPRFRPSLPTLSPPQSLSDDSRLRLPGRRQDQKERTARIANLQMVIQKPSRNESPGTRCCWCGPRVCPSTGRQSGSPRDG